MSNVRFLALGDSYTIGEGVPYAEGWPAKLVALTADGEWRLDNPTIIAQTGWTTDELLENIGKTKLMPPYDLVTLLIGVNNQYRGNPIAQYEEEFQTLLQKAISLSSGGRCVVVSIPDWGTTPFAAGRDRGQIASEIDRYNEINRNQTMAAGSLYVDITEVTRAFTDEPDAWVEDGLHPSGLVYDAWATRIFPIVASLFDTGVT